MQNPKIATDREVEEAFHDLFQRKLRAVRYDSAKVAGIASDEEVKEAINDLFERGEKTWHTIPKS